MPAGKETAAKGVNLNEPGSIRELAQVVRSQIGPRHSAMTLELSPPELGRVRIDVHMHQQVLAVRIQADTAAGRDALRNRLTELRSALEQQGIQVDRLDVDLRPPAPPADQPRNTQGQQQQHLPNWDGSAGGGQRDPESGNHHSGGSPSKTSGGWSDDPVGPAPGMAEGNNTVRPAETGVDLIV